MSATEVADGVRSGAFSAVEAAQSALDRIDQVNPLVNAMVEVRRDAALDEARAADDRLRSGEQVGVLHGVPITIKVNTNVSGLPTTDGVAAYADHVATETDPQAESLLAAGATFLGRTNCPPFATRWTTESDFYGATLNPFDRAVTPGGSSGGAAAAVATGMGALAQGSDIGGSIRYPAACCGTVGLRPTPGRVPAWAGPPTFDPPMAVQAFVEQGPIARSVADVRLGLAAMERYDARDPRAVASASRIPRVAGPARVAVVTDPGGPGLRGSSTPEAIEATRTAAGWLDEAGYEVVEVEQPILGEASRLWWELALTEFSIGMVDEVARVGEPGVRRFFDLMFEVYEKEFGEVGLTGFVAGWSPARHAPQRDVGLLARLPAGADPCFWRAAVSHGLRRRIRGADRRVDGPPMAADVSSCAWSAGHRATGSRHGRCASGSADHRPPLRGGGGAGRSPGHRVDGRPSHADRPPTRKELRWLSGPRQRPRAPSLG